MYRISVLGWGCQAVCSIDLLHMEYSELMPRLLGMRLHTYCLLYAMHKPWSGTRDAYIYVHMYWSFRIPGMHKSRRRLYEAQA